jgi:4-hydroxybenzoate polyprenyltransferase
LSFITCGNIWMGIMALSIAYLTCFFQGLEFNSTIAIITFAMPFFVYTINRFTDEEDKINTPERYDFFRKRAKVWIAVSSGLLIIALSLAATNFSTFAIMAASLLGGIVYNFTGLKKIFLFKNLTIGYSWMMIPLLVGSCYSVFNFQLLTIALVVFFNIGICSSIVCDIKDIAGDATFDVKTIPVIYGVRTTKIIVLSLMIIPVIWIMAGVHLGLLPFKYLLLLFLFAYQALYTIMARSVANMKYYSLFVDAESLLLTLSIMAWNCLGLMAKWN